MRAAVVKVVRTFSYLTVPFGLNASAAEIDDSSFNTAANVCDETVALANTTDTFTADAPSDICTRTAKNALWSRAGH